MAEGRVVPAETESEIRRGSEGSLPCAHCGLPTLAPTETPRNQVFCCSGCRSVFEVINGMGLGGYYDIREAPDASSTQEANRFSSLWEQFDDPELIALSAPRQVSRGLAESTMMVGGLHCGACAWLIENALGNVEGVLSSNVRMNRHSLTVMYDPQRVNLSDVARTIHRIGYEPIPLRSEATDPAQEENRRLLIRIAVAGFLAANAMWIAIALYAGGSTSPYGRFLEIAGTVLGISAVLGPGRTFLQSAWASIRTQTPHMDLPVALGLSTGALFGAVNLFRNSGEVYFDSIAMLVFLLLVGRWIQFRQQARATKAVDLMLTLVPTTANRVSDRGEVKLVAVEALEPGQIIEVPSNDSIPADGTLLTDGLVGQALVDCSLLTGESQPIAQKPGDMLVSGALNVGPPIRLSVIATGAQSRIGRVMELVEKAASEKTPIVMLANQVGGYFVLVVTLLAVAAFAVSVSGGVEAAISKATAILIVACPCALALATPLSVSVGLGRAAKRGILIRDGSVFQHLAGRGVLWFDKTGTLTAGNYRVCTVHGDTSYLPHVAALESKCVHPVAAALVRYQQEQQPGHAIPKVENFGRFQQGVTGEVDGLRIQVGTENFLDQEVCTISSELRAAGEDLAKRGESPVFVAVDGILKTVLGLADPIRPEAFPLVERLRDTGWRLGILSGDHREVVGSVGRSLGISAEDCYAELSPEEKLQKIRTSNADGASVMVGDGANDAAALATADVGVALQGGAEVSLQAAPIFLSRGLGAMKPLLEASTRTQRVIIGTFLVSLGYNCLAVALAFIGYITPLVAAILMPVSSVSVLALVIGIPTFRKSS